MKNFLIVAILLSIFPFIYSCNNDSVKEGGFKMLARVKENGEDIAVTVIESEYAYGDFLIITSSNTEFQDKNGNKIKKSDLKPTDTVEITYNGQTMLSYPPKVVALKIVLQ